jgi:hypothetical protein
VKADHASALHRFVGRQKADCGRSDCLGKCEQIRRFHFVRNFGQVFHYTPADYQPLKVGMKLGDDCSRSSTCRRTGLNDHSHRRANPFSLKADDENIAA